MSRGNSLLIAGLVAGLATSATFASSALAKGAHQDKGDARVAFAQGKRLYDAGKRQAAVEKFKEAYRLSRNPLLLYNIGFVFDELSDRPLAIFYYDKFLTDVPDGPKTAQSRSLAKQRLVVLRRSLGSHDAAPEREPARAATVERPAPVSRARAQGKGLRHEVVDSAVANHAVDVVAYVPSEQHLGLILYYRSGQASEYASAPMTGDGDQRAAKIPARVVRGDQVAYYIEVADAHGKPLARSGNPDKPHLVSVEAAPYHSQREDENPLALSPRADARRDGAGPTSDESHRSPRALKWTFTVGAAALLGASALSYITAGNYQEALDAELEGCTGDCTPTTDYELELDSGRKTWTIATYATLGAGVVSAGVATWLWVRSDSKPRHDERGLAAMPMVGPDVVGASATLRF
jgi:tetratricopeptide (TPR) repeat protein